MKYPIDLSNISFFTEPFRYFVGNSIIEKDFENLLLNWLEKQAPWKLVEADFYEQYEFSFWDLELPDDVAILCDKEFVKYLTLRMSEVFQINLNPDRVDITAHKLISDQRIRIHNDYIEGAETHRLIVQINRDWNEEMGGLLMLFGSDNPEDLRDVIAPISGSTFGFEISPKSHHAVSKVYGGERYTLVFSFYKN